MILCKTIEVQKLSLSCFYGTETALTDDKKLHSHLMSKILNEKPFAQKPVFFSIFILTR